MPIPKEILDLQNQTIVQKNELAGQILAAEKIAEWIFYDAYYNCDGQAAVRTAFRLNEMNEQHGKDLLFGIAGYWAMRGYWKMQDAFRVRGVTMRPDLLPGNVQELLDKPGPEGPKRAYVSAQQFVATITHENILMAKAIFDVAYEAGIEDYVGLLQNILIIAMRFTHKAEAVIAQVSA